MALTAIIFGYIAVSAGLFALAARKKTWMGGAMRTVIIILSVIIACIVSTAISSLFSDAIYNSFLGSIMESLGDLSASVPLLGNTVVAMASVLLAPLFFIVIFSVLRLVLSLLGKIPEKLLLETLVPKKIQIKWVSILVGALNGALVAIITVVPICGYITLASNILTATAELTEETTQTATLQLAEEEESFDLIGAVADLGESPAVKVVNVVASPVFDALTTTNVPTGDGSTVKFTLSKDIANIFNIVDHVGVFMDDMSSGTVSENTQQNMHDLSDAFSKSPWTLRFASDTFSSLADAWLVGDDFMGSSSPELPEVFAPTFSKALTVIGDVTPETVEEDLNTTFDVFYYFLKGDLMNSAASSNDIMATLGESNILSSIIDTLEANERFAPLADEITDMGMRVVASSIGKVELGSDEQYDTFVGELSTSLNSSLSMTEEERDAFVKESVKTAFVQYEMDVPEDVAITFSEKMIEDLGSDGEITDEEVHNYLDSYVVVEE